MMSETSTKIELVGGPLCGTSVDSSDLNAPGRKSFLIRGILYTYRVEDSDKTAILDGAMPLPHSE